MDATWPLASCPSLVVRVHFVPRFDAGEKYLQLLAVADVVLHPFPFGGSRTSAEGEAESEGAGTRHLTTTTSHRPTRVPRPLERASWRVMGGGCLTNNYRGRVCAVSMAVAQRYTWARPSWCCATRASEDAWPRGRYLGSTTI